MVAEIDRRKGNSGNTGNTSNERAETETAVIASVKAAADSFQSLNCNNSLNASVADFVYVCASVYICLSVSSFCLCPFVCPYAPTLTSSDESRTLSTRKPAVP